MKRLILIATSALAANPLHAITLDFGNAAPVAQRIELRIDGVAVADAGYLEFGHVEVGEGSVTIEAVGADDGEPLASTKVTLQPSPGVRPIALVQGNGREVPFSLSVYQGVFSERGNSSEDALGHVHVAHHHVAVVPGNGGSPPLEGQQWCSGKDPGRFRFGGSLGSMDWYYGAMRGITLPSKPDYAQKECGLLVQGPFGSVQLALGYELQRDLRFVFAGDGKSFPYTLTAVREGGEVVASSGLSEPVPGAVVESDHVWYDLARPAQAVALYPLPGSDLLAGYWFTHDEAGNSRWLFLDGMREGTARYELSVYRSAVGAGVQSAGSAQLFYVDCNNAEIRLFETDGDFHTLRLRRSKSVADCDILSD